MPSLFSSNYLSRQPIEKAVQNFAKRFSKDMQVLDIGCGDKPYAHFFQCQYLGLDPYPGTKADITRNAWDSGLSDNSCDGVILNQSLEHIPNTKETILEIMRVLKPGGFVLVTVPHAMRHHSVPRPATDAPYHNFNTKKIPYWNDDYWRFTKFGLITLFSDFHILILYPNQSYLVTLIQLWNYFLASFNLGNLLALVYFVNNILAEIVHYGSSLIAQRNERYRALIHEGLTIDHTLVAQKKPFMPTEDASSKK